MPTARLGAVTGKTKPLFRCPALPGFVNKRLINNNRLIKILDLTGGILYTEQSGTRFGN